MKNLKLKIFLFLLFVAICNMRYAICESFAQEQENKLVSLTKRIIEAKTNEDLYAPFEELKNLYSKDNKYSEFVEFLKSLSEKKDTVAPFVNYYVAFTRYQQLKYLEEMQSWDEYFSQGNTYRDEITQGAQKTIDTTTAKDALNLYSRILLWRFHKDQEDTLQDTALTDLMNAVLEFAKDAKNITAIKEIADQLLLYGERTKSKGLYKIYVDKLITQDIKDAELSEIALGFYKEGNLDLSQTIYDVYIERIIKATPKEKLSSISPILVDIAKKFSYKDEGSADPFYAEKIFKQIEAVCTKDVFDEQLLYLRAINLEKSKEYLLAKDIYLDLVGRYPKSIYVDEAEFKAGVIYTYVTKDITTGKTYFEKLSQKETLNPELISSLYQLGLLSQWQEDLTKAKEYYNKLLEKAGEGFQETVAQAKERLKEIEEAKPIDYNLKTFLGVSLKEDYATLDMSRLDLKSLPAKVKKGQSTNISAIPYLGETGCFQVEVQYLWSGNLGTTAPQVSQSSFSTTYTESGTKTIFVVAVSPAEFIDRNIIFVDVD